MTFPRRLYAEPRRLPPPRRRAPVGVPGSTDYTQTPSDTEDLSDSRAFDVGQSRADDLGLTDTVVAAPNYFYGAGALVEWNSGAGSCVIPSSAKSGTTGLLVVTGSTSTSNETPVTVTPTRSGLTFTRVTTTPDFPESDDNFWTDAFIVSGLTSSDAGGTVNIALSADRATSAQFIVFENSFDTPGTLGERTGTSATVTAPTMTCVPGQVVLVVATDRSPAGTGYTGVLNSNGRTVNVRSYVEGAVTGGSCSILVADFVETGSSTGTTTVTYNHTSTNAQALHIPLHIEVRDESQTDNTGLTDLVQLASTNEATDTLGLSDSLVFSIAATITDTVGLVDEVASPASHDLSIDDAIYVSDTDDEEQLGVEETIDTDALGTTDAISFDHGPGVDDAAGLVDSTVFDLASVLSEALGLTDEATVIRGIIASQTDAQDLTDAVSVEAGRGVTDSAALTDSNAFDLAQVTTESLALTDSLGIELTDGSVLSTTDVFDLTDSRVVDRDSVLAEASGISDSLLIEIESVFADVVGLEDALEIAADFQRTLDEFADLTDEITFEGNFEPTLEDFAGMYDAVTVTVGLPRNVTFTAELLPARKSAVLVQTTRKALILL